jgi:hypothetical protein
MSVSGVSSSPLSINNPRAEFERLRQAHAQEGPDAAGRQRRVRGDDDGPKPSAAATALASAAPDPNAAQRAGAMTGKVNFFA